MTELVLEALAALESAQVAYCLRNDPAAATDPRPGEDNDVLVSPDALAAAEAALRRTGFHHLEARGHPGHRFFVACDGGRWVKLDVLWERRYEDERLGVDDVLAGRQRHDGVWVASRHDLAAHEARRMAGQRPPRRLRDRIARALPLHLRRSGPVIAVMGPDGAGKSSVLTRVAVELPVGVTLAYLGTAPSGAPASSEAPGDPVPWRELAFLLRKLARTWKRLVPLYLRAWRGHIVLTDRHPIEVLAIEPDRSALGRRVERFLLTRAVPHPDVLVVLDAPAHVLCARKAEHPAETIERWRTGYRNAFGGKATFVDVDRPLDDVVRDLLQTVWDALAVRRRWDPTDD